MNLAEKLQALEQQADQAKTVYIKYQGAIEAVKLLIDEQSQDLPQPEKEVKKTKKPVGKK